MTTKREYFFSTALTAQATVLKVERTGAMTELILDRTIFVCQGGGQPADGGTIEGFEVLHVEASKSDPDLLIHRLNGGVDFCTGDTVNLKIDFERREINSRFHTGGHLLAAVVEMSLPGVKARSGHHWPGEARVEFNCESTIDTNSVVEIETSIARYIRTDIPILTSLADDGTRYVQIGSFPPVRCSGTHVARLSELHSLTLRSVKQKNGTLRIGYELGRVNSGD